MNLTPKLIVGLGNPGREYTWTRHNLGFLVLDRLAEDLKLKWKTCSFTKAYITHDKDKTFYLLKPQTFVNNSGVAVAAVMDRLKVALEDVLVVCDDLNIDFQEIRIRPEGSSGGHNGLKSITEKLGGQKFPRLRLGIAHPGHKDKVVDYVLEEFSKEEKKELEKFIDEAANCCQTWLSEGVLQAMNQYNRRKET